MDYNQAPIGGVLANPESDVPRLIYADWCEENGDTDRAAFIRAQCAGDHLAADAYLLHTAQAVAQH